MDTKDLSKKEIDAWRLYFLDTMYSSEMRYVPEKYKQRLATYFLSIPSECFEHPIKEWHRCISSLLQHLEDIK